MNLTTLFTFLILAVILGVTSNSFSKIALLLQINYNNVVAKLINNTKIKNMTSQRRWLKIWARTVGMPIGVNDEDKPEFLPIKQTDVKKALAFRTFWVLLHILTCLLIIAGNGRVMGWW